MIYRQPIVGHLSGLGGSPFGARRARRGDVPAVILSVLAEQPSSGYRIMRQLDERSEGAWHPSPGSVYPTLENLIESGLVHQDDRDDSKAYALTPAGEAYVASHRNSLDARCAAVTACGGGDVRELRGAANQLMLAVFQVARVGTKSQKADARQLLIETRSALYQVLAGECGGVEREELP